jgi:hypothetical protein
MIWQCDDMIRAGKAADAAQTAGHREQGGFNAS